MRLDIDRLVLHRSRAQPPWAGSPDPQPISAGHLLLDSLIRSLPPSGAPTAQSHTPRITDLEHDPAALMRAANC
jgi:hypothetical protein